MKYGAVYTSITRNTCKFSRTIWPFRATELDYVVEELKNKKPTRVLDYGCNDGHFTRRIADEVGGVVEGADINDHALAFARETHPEITFTRISDEFSKEHQGAYDAIVMLHVLEHIKNRQEVLTDIRKLLSQDGVLIIAVPQERIRGDATVPQLFWNVCTGVFENPHVVSFDYEQLVAELREAGFTVRDHMYTHYRTPKTGKKRRWDSWSLVVSARQSLE